MKYSTLLFILFACNLPALANNLQQRYERAYFLETAKGQTEQAMEIYREIAATEPTDTNRETVLLALEKLNKHYQFPYNVDFQTGFPRFREGDSITITRIMGSTDTFKTGGTYRVCGSYTLASEDEATLAFFVTATNGNGRSQILPEQHMRVQRGSGTFEVINQLNTGIWPHLSFYPIGNGSGFGGIYFGAGKWLRTDSVHQNKETPTTEKSLQEQIDQTPAGGTVHIPPGRHKGPFQINKALTLRGSGRDTCILECTSDRPLIQVTGKGKVNLDSLTFQSQMETRQKTEFPAASLLAQNASVDASNCRFIALGHKSRSPSAVSATGFSTVNLQDCHFSGYNFTIAYSDGATGKVENCTIQNPGHCGITVAGECNVQITGNLITGSEYHGIRCTGGTLHAESNLIINNKNRGIYLGNKSAHGSIVNNAIIGNGSGISIFGRTDVDIKNNVLLANRYAGIDTRATAGFTAKNNIFYANKSGLTLYDGGSLNAQIRKNTFWNNTTHSTDVLLPRSTFKKEPQFRSLQMGDFGLHNRTLQTAKQGLNNPQPIQRLWQTYAKLDGNNTQDLLQSLLTQREQPAAAPTPNLQSLIDTFNMPNGKLSKVLKTFGEPQGFYLGRKSYTRKNLPEKYAIQYPNGFSIWMYEDYISEFRFEEPTSYSIGGLTVGSSLQEVFAVLGKPSNTLNGKECDYQSGTLYRNSKGRPNGHAYYANKGLRLFLMHDRIIALYIEDNTILGGHR